MSKPKIVPGLRTRLLKAGLWNRDDIPNKVELQILLYLAVSDEARLIVRGDQRWGHDAGVTNNGFEPAFENNRRANLTSLLTDWHDTGSWRPWVDPDPEYDKLHKFPKDVHAYKINDKGYEAIAQHSVWTKYDDRVLAEMKRALKEYRASAQALRPK
jgi:hypothetical protein